jgi:polyvinyl alcohol dehydrogenase (cytochrome)
LYSFLKGIGLMKTVIKITARVVIVIVSLLTCTTGICDDGATLFQNKCSMCHRAGSETRAPLPEVLRKKSRQSILTALETGLMKLQGSTLTPDERATLAAYLGTPDTPGVDASAGACAGDPTPMSDALGWNGWGADISNSRFQPAGVAGLNPEQVPKLKLKWAFGFPGASSASAQPTIAGDRVFEGSEDGTVYALDARRGCVIWKFKAQSTIRSTISIGARAAFFGDTQANVYSVSKENGALLWSTRVDDFPTARITGSPALYGDRLYVPVSSGEEGTATQSNYECCKFRGSVVALDIESGKQIWKTHVIPEVPRPTARNSKGVQLWGPSGAAVWSAPTLDPSRHAVYVAVGNNYSEPPSKFSDAVLSLDMDSGKVLWSKQLTAGDRWNLACVNADKTNCPEGAGPDYDFGSSPILRSLAGGHALVIASQKSGAVYALDPDRRGKLVWQSQVGHGGLLGGIEFGGAADERYLYYPLSDWLENDPLVGGGLFALRIDTGAKIWSAPPFKPACVGQAGCSAAQIAPVTAIPGVVFSGSMDGHLRAYGATDGSLIWDFDTVKDFQTTNGVKAHGGSLNQSGPTIAHGMLYVTSGNFMPGNVLLAFSVDGK